ncbi:MAG: hypothetical protein U0228_11335 [Myxococcaceae bacterium]
MKWSLVVVVALAACGPTPPKPCAVAITPGTADDNLVFVPVTEGQDVTVHMGPQGGFHVYGSIQATGVNRTGKLTMQLMRADGTGLSGLRSFDLATITLEDVPCGWGRTADALFLDVMTIDQARGQSATMVWSLSGTNADQKVERHITLR